MMGKTYLICTSFIPPVNAGAERNAYNFAVFLKEKGFTPVIATFAKKTHNTNCNIKIINLPYFNGNCIYKILSFLLLVIPSLFLAIIHADIVFIYGGHFLGWELIILVSRLFRKKTVLRSTMLEVDDIQTLTLKRKNRFIRKKILSLLNYYYSINPAFTELCRSVFNEKIKIIQTSQGVNTKIFQPVNKKRKEELRKKLRLPLHKTIILSAGYLLERKGYRETFSVLSKVQDSFLYIIVGDYKLLQSHYLHKKNEEMAELFKLGKTLLKEKIHFVGPNENIQHYYQASDIFVLNSYQEGTPNVLLEAMACGLPVCIRDIRGINNYITIPFVNSLVHKNQDEFQHNIIKLLKNKSLRYFLGNNANKYIGKYFSFNKTLSDLKEIFHQ